MQQENKSNPKGSAILENCSRLVLNGITDVREFDDEAISLDSELGILEIRGENMKIKSFDTSSGDMLVEGYIYALVYKKDTKNQSFLSRVFR